MRPHQMPDPAQRAGPVLVAVLVPGAVLGPGPGPVRVFVAVFTARLAGVVVPVLATWGRLAHASQGAGKARLQHLDNSHPDPVATRSPPGSDRPPWLRVRPGS